MPIWTVRRVVAIEMEIVSANFYSVCTVKHYIPNFYVPQFLTALAPAADAFERRIIGRALGFDHR